MQWLATRIGWFASTASDIRKLFWDPSMPDPNNLRSMKVFHLLPGLRKSEDAPPPPMSRSLHRRRPRRHQRGLVSAQSLPPRTRTILSPALKARDLCAVRRDARRVLATHRVSFPATWPWSVAASSGPRHTTATTASLGIRGGNLTPWMSSLSPRARATRPT